MAAPAVASAERIQATLTGYEEVPAVSTVAGGEFRAMVSRDNQAIDYELPYSGPQGDGATGPYPRRPAERERQHRHPAVPDGDDAGSGPLPAHSAPAQRAGGQIKGMVSRLLRR